MRIYGWSDGRGGVFHYRIREPLRGLRLLGHETATGQALTVKQARTYDVILVRALHDPWSSRAWRLLKESNDVLLVYDLDDDIWAWHPNTKAFQYWNRERRLQAELNIQLADLVTTPSYHLAALLEHLNPNVHVLPNTVPKWLTKIGPNSQPPGVFVIGWEGAAQHLEDLQLIYTPVFRFMLRHPDVHFWLWGPDEFIELPAHLDSRIRCFGWQPDVPSYYRSLCMNIALAPLQEQPFNETKSAIRVQEHSALGIPIIANPSLAYDGFLIHGENGLHANDEFEWELRFEQLYEDSRFRQRLGARGRELAQSWTTEANAQVRARLYQEALNVKP